MMRRPVLTRREGFCKFPDGSLFSVNADMPAALALEQASNLLSCVESLTVSLADGSAGGSEVFAVQYLAEMAKALVDASAAGLPDGEGIR